MLSWLIWDSSDLFSLASVSINLCSKVIHFCLYFCASSLWELSWSLSLSIWPAMSWLADCNRPRSFSYVSLKHRKCDIGMVHKIDHNSCPIYGNRIERVNLRRTKEVRLSKTKNSDNLNMIGRQYYHTSSLHFYVYFTSTFGNHDTDVIDTGGKAKYIYKHNCLTKKMNATFTWFIHLIQILLALHNTR